MPSKQLEKVYYKVEPIFPPVKILKRIYQKFREPKRYKYLFEIIRKNKCKKIMEIGTWNGNHALQMIEEAKEYFPAKEIEYYGFDLFELMDGRKYIEEISKRAPALSVVKERLEKTKAKINLYKGDTREILPGVINNLPKMDFVFIDGGHSIETIENDWKYTQQVMDEQTIVIFDDYWNRDGAGCKKVIENIDRAEFDVKILPKQDKFKKEWGILKINFVQVKRRGGSIL